MWMLVLLFLASNAAASCESGYVEYNGNCYADPKPVAEPEQNQASDEKPPQDKMPSYEREGVHADMPKSTAAEDATRDEEKLKAEQEGKDAAGIK